MLVQRQDKCSKKYLVGAVQQVNAALSDILADCLVAKAAQDVPERGPASWQAARGCWLPKLQIKDHYLHHCCHMVTASMHHDAICTNPRSVSMDT